MHYAVAYGQVECARLLIRQRADLFAEDNVRGPFVCSELCAATRTRCFPHKFRSFPKLCWRGSAHACRFRDGTPAGGHEP